MSFFGWGGGGGGGGGGSTTGAQTNIAREAPGVESRKLALYDEALNLAKTPISLPAYQTAKPSQLQQDAFTDAGTTGVGLPQLAQGIGAIGTAQSLASGLPATGAGSIASFMNPYQTYVTDEINRQAQMRQNQLSAEAVQSGAFGGARQGVASAELDRGRLAQIGQVSAGMYGQALGAAQAQQRLGVTTGMQAAQQYGVAGAQAQQMQQGDIQSQLQAGGIQQQLAQQALGAQRQTQMARAYEPYQRMEFMKGIMTNLPTSASQITTGTGPGVNPLAQAAGAGIGAYAAYNMVNRPASNINIGKV